MKKMVWLLPALLLAACGEAESGGSEEEQDLYITTSFSVLGDIAATVAGEHAEVDYIVPIGEEPHEYEPVPSDFRNVNEADVFYVNGLGLEEWLQRVVENAADTDVVETSTGVEEIPLEGEDGVDPHAWLSPANIPYYVDNIVADLSERAPDAAADFEANGEQLKQEAKELSAQIEEELADIPEEQRLIVVSENAFKYFGADFDIDTDGIWELNSHEEGTTGQMNRIIDVIQDRGVPAVFVESTVDPRYMETVSDNSGVPIAGEVYTDAVGEEGSGAETYLDMLRHNASVFAEGLAE
ncbi:metal ABC transporter solute-binding protein, Zn/Mn family [Alkalicoccus luteus]|uniref:Zinc ABC transporter solute-binding protein n=1 Tax=Alkalicoccus luteus TaxID=1237094 RepID=A0A969PL02_9BACI|nr:zinc ABC transporter substrate-binding protein [Alkalicoccus luteus]NJP36102.1 zinc ABC transporter solute-binding protein [Alkalicoccus luteus]